MARHKLKQSPEEKLLFRGLLRRLRLREDEIDIPPRGPDTFQAGFHVTRTERDWLRSRAIARGISPSHYMLLVFRGHAKAIGEEP